MDNDLEYWRRESQLTQEEAETCEPPFYNRIKEYQVQNRKGRKPKYLTVERWEKWLNNDWYHLTCRLGRVEKLIWLVLGGLIVAALVDRLVG